MLHTNGSADKRNKRFDHFALKILDILYFMILCNNNLGHNYIHHLCRLSVYLFVQRSPTFLVTAFSTKDKDIKRISRLGHPRSESFYITPVKLAVTHCTKIAQ